jgi:hypothetical protein
MISNDVDPSLCAGEPLLESLDDGFSPPHHDAEAASSPPAEPGRPPEFALGTKSPF